MSVCIEHNNFKAHHNNFSQNVTVCEKPLELSITSFSKWNVFKTIKVWNARIVQRRDLAGLDERMLADIGYTAEQSRIESIKPFWK